MSEKEWGDIFKDPTRECGMGFKNYSMPDVLDILGMTNANFRTNQEHDFILKIAGEIIRLYGEGWCRDHANIVLNELDARLDLHRQEQRTIKQKRKKKKKRRRWF